MLAGPDCSMIVQQSEVMFNTTSSSISHHQEAHSLQMKFYKDVMSFVETVKQMGNPSLAMSTGLVALDAQDVMEPEVAASLSPMPAVGETLHAKYTTQRLENPLIPVSDTIPRQNSFTFANLPDWNKKKRCPETKYDTRHTTVSVTPITPRCWYGRLLLLWIPRGTPMPGWPWNTSNWRRSTCDRLYISSNWTYNSKQLSHSCASGYGCSCAHDPTN